MQQHAVDAMVLVAAALAVLAVAQDEALQPRRATAARTRLRTILQMEKYGNCEDYPDMPNNFTETRMVLYGKRQLFSGTFVFRRNYVKFTKVTVLIRKCQDRADPNCEAFQTWRFGPESCSLLTMKDMLWTPLFAAIPQIACPIKPGSHYLPNATVDLDRLKMIKFPEKGYWKVRVLGDTDKVTTVCIDLELFFTKISSD